MSGQATSNPAERLLPYVPRLAIEWLAADPDRLVTVIEGSMVFVDISGFTKMSERLARRGKIGAEEVTDVMNSTFGALLSIAYDVGGGLIKFGGDALLLLFRGDGHEHRAASAAFSMRAALRSRGRIPTSAGAIMLRMSVGVHSGEFHFFLPGRSHRELVVAGPAASRTVEMEQIAEAGEILISSDCADRLPARCRGAAKGPGFLLRSAPPPGPTPIFTDPPADIDLTQLISTAMRPQLLGGLSEPEHRIATIAFIHFDGADAAIGRDANEFAGMLDELVHTAQVAADEHGVCFLATDIDHDGGKIILTAGAPIATATDEELLLRAVRQIADAGCELPVRIGVNRGPIFAGDVGAPHRRTYTVMGDAVNLAARLMARATPGTIVATPAVLERSQTLFTTQSLEPFFVKGKAEAINACEVGSIAGVRSEPARYLPFVGRAAEIASLEHAITEARAGHGRILDIVGEAGIGKTRLVEQLRDRATDFTVLRTSSEPYAISTPYFTARRLLRDLLGVELSNDAAEMTRRLTERIGPHRPELLAWIPLIAIPLDVPVRATSESDAIDPTFRKAKTIEVVGELLDALIDGPAMLIFEDAYWMDDASRELMLDVAARRGFSPWLIVITRRPNTEGFDAGRGMPTMTIKLEPLTGDESATLAASAADTSLLPPERLAALSERAGGNPLFLQELVAAAAAAAAASSEPSGDALPESVEAVVTARIDTLGPSDRTLLRYASVLGTTFSHNQVAAILPEGTQPADSLAWERLAEFVGRDAEGRFQFHHAIFRDVAYEGLPFRRRRLLHQRAGEFFEVRRGDDMVRYAELLALHFTRAQVLDKAWTYAHAAGDGARRKYANVEAAEFYRAALDAARKLPTVTATEIAATAESLGDVCETAGLYTEAAAAYEQSRKLTRIGGTDRPALLLKEGVLRERAGRYTDALRWYGRGLRSLRSLRSLRIRGRADMILEPEPATDDWVALTLACAGIRLRQGRYPEGAYLAEQAVTVATDPAQRAHACYLLHLAYTEMGDPRRADFRERALPIYESLGNLRGQANVVNNLGIEAYYEGRWGEALSLYARSRDTRVRIGDTVGAAQMSNNIGEILSDQGRYDEASAVFRAFVATCRAAGYRLGVVHGTSNLARIDARRGDPGAAEQLRGCLAEFEQMHADSYIVDANARLAESAMLCGAPRDALERADATRTMAAEMHIIGAIEAMVYRIMGCAHLQMGESALAQDALDESLRIARAANTPYELALSHEAWALLATVAGRSDAQVHAASARDLFAKLDVISTPAIPLPTAPTPSKLPPSG